MRHEEEGVLPAKQHICTGAGSRMGVSKGQRKDSVTVTQWGRERAPQGEVSASAIFGTIMLSNKQMQTSAVCNSVSTARVPAELGINLNSALCVCHPPASQPRQVIMANGKGSGMHGSMQRSVKPGLSTVIPSFYWPEKVREQRCYKITQSRAWIQGRMENWNHFFELPQIEK